MSKPYDNVRLVTEGQIGGVQGFSFGLTLAPFTTANLGAVTQADLDSWLEDVGNDPLFTALNAGLNGGSALKTIASTAVAYLGASAYLYSAGSNGARLQSTYRFPTAVAGTGAQNHPAQVALVASLRSGTPGRHGRGRIYLPANGVAVSPTGAVSNANCDGVAKTVAGLIHEINVTQLGQDDASVIVGSTAGKYLVLRAEVDNDPDIQRRRSDKLVASYVANQAVPEL